MKKLMIAAAAAAMIGGAQAAYTASANAAYDFKATLKTTTGKTSYITFKANLGQHSQLGTFWYEDAVLTAENVITSKRVYDKATGTFITRRFTLPVLQCLTPDTKNMGALKIAASTTVYLGDAGTCSVEQYYDDATKKYYVDEAFGEAVVDSAAITKDMVILVIAKYIRTNADGTDLVVSGSGSSFTTSYGQKSANKWCETGSARETRCYRTAGTKKIVDYVDGCCDGWAASADAKRPNYYAWATGAHGFAGVFGSLDPAVCNKVELCLELTGNNLWDDAASADWLVIAGQGSLVYKKTYKGDNITVNDVTFISSVSGNVVGVIEPPVCANCCVDDDYADAFKCSDWTDLVDIDYTTDPATYNTFTGTAAWGTFTLKMNDKATKALY